MKQKKKMQAITDKYMSTVQEATIGTIKQTQKKEKRKIIENYHFTKREYGQ